MGGESLAKRKDTPDPSPYCLFGHVKKKRRNLDLTFKHHCQDNGGNDQETCDKAPAEISVLEKGLNFTTALTRIPAKEIVKVTEVACQRPDGESADLLCNEVVGFMQNAKSPKSNLTEAERDALKTLKSNKDIIILPAGKSSCGDGQ